MDLRVTNSTNEPWFARAFRVLRKLVTIPVDLLTAWLRTRTRRGQLERPVELAVEPPPALPTEKLDVITFESEHSQIHCRVHNMPRAKCTCTQPGITRWLEDA